MHHSTLGSRVTKRREKENRVVVKAAVDLRALRGHAQRRCPDLIENFGIRVEPAVR